MAPRQKLYSIHVSSSVAFNNALHQNAVWHLCPSFHWQKPFGNTVREDQMEVDVALHSTASTSPWGWPLFLTHTGAVFPRLWWLSSSLESRDSSICLIWGGGGIDDDKASLETQSPIWLQCKEQIFSFICVSSPPTSSFSFSGIITTFIITNYLLALHKMSGALCTDSAQNNSSKEMPLSLFYWGSVTSRYAATNGAF